MIGRIYPVADKVYDYAGYIQVGDKRVYFGLYPKRSGVNKVEYYRVVELPEEEVERLKNKVKGLNVAEEEGVK